MDRKRFILKGGVRVSLALLGGVLLLLMALSGMVAADPIDPPEGYPKLKLSMKTVTPTLAHTGGMSLTYIIEIRNTGAYTAEGTQLTDTFPENTTYNGDASVSTGTAPTVTGDTLTWVGDVGFDTTVVLSFTVDIDAAYAGSITNTAVISQAALSKPVTVTAETMVTDKPILVLEKSAMPAKPGAEKPMCYTLKVRNVGQPTNNLPITVTDEVPADTTLLEVGADGVGAGSTVTWTRNVTLDQGESTVFTFSVTVGDVPSGTVITNDTYQVNSAETDIVAGDAYTVTIVDPIFRIFKSVWPDPPGSNRELTYTITVLNLGSLATDLVISDRVPSGVEYHHGGDSSTSGYVRWQWPELDTGDAAEFSFTGYIGDVMDVDVINEEYSVCSAEGVCASGDPFSSVVQGPTFEIVASMDPIAKKPGGGRQSGPVTPTLVIRNSGPGNAIDAYAILKFLRISVNDVDLYAEPDSAGTLHPSYKCGDKCVAFDWVGSLNVGESVTFTTIEGQSTIGGEEGTNYTATVVITDELDGKVTQPFSGTAMGKVTHLAYLQPYKSGPSVIGRGQEMTYTIRVANTALATDDPPFPYLWDHVPDHLEVVEVSHGGVYGPISVTQGTQFVSMDVVSWTLPAFGTGEVLDESRWFRVKVADDVVSGTQLVNEYETRWYEAEDTAFYSATGKAITTTVVDVGLIDSFKEVTPAIVSPGPGNILTYVVHLVNSSPVNLSGVKVEDHLPWKASTYQKDAVASAGQISDEDIVSFKWTGSVAAFSEELITVTVLVDADYKGPVKNTVVITHSSLLETVETDAVAYVTDKPELRISKSAELFPALGELEYTIVVRNLGQQATNLVITDTVPSNVTYVAGSATAGGKLVGEQVQWEVPVLKIGGQMTFKFRVAVGEETRIVNDDYAVKCAEGEVAVGTPVITNIGPEQPIVYLPLVLRRAP